MSELRLVEHNMHRVAVDGRNLLFHIPTSSLFELDSVGGEIIDLFERSPRVTPADVRQRFDGRFDADDVVGTIKELIELDVLSDGRPRRPDREPIKIENFPLSTIVLNVNTGCNLSCTYCYKEDLTTPAKGDLMSFETAVKSIELLLEEGKSRACFGPL